MPDGGDADRRVGRDEGGPLGHDDGGAENHVARGGPGGDDDEDGRHAHEEDRQGQESRPVSEFRDVLTAELRGHEGAGAEGAPRDQDQPEQPRDDGLHRRQSHPDEKRGGDHHAESEAGDRLHERGQPEDQQQDRGHPVVAGADSFEPSGDVIPAPGRRQGGGQQDAAEEDESDLEDRRPELRQ
ncbi:UNVERIFIED_ORG: hypothetical protein EDC92_11082 [Dietzia maris]